MRIDKFISESGIASRKEASVSAKRGLITVDGKVVKDASVHINPEIQTVSYMGHEVLYRRYVYVMLNKPQGYVSATEDSKLPVVTELLPENLRKMELFPVGRLDKDTTGLMVLTNNGKLAHHLLSPKRHVTKEYSFECSPELPKDAEEKFRLGIVLADGYECKPSILSCNPERTGGTIILTEGKYHQIKRMTASLGSKITALRRIKFADIPLDESLGEGEWRYLTSTEIKSLEEKAPQNYDK